MTTAVLDRYRNKERQDVTQTWKQRIVETKTEQKQTGKAAKANRVRGRVTLREAEYYTVKGMPINLWTCK